MSNKATVFLKNILGEDFLETLEKTELYKPGTRTVVDPEEMRIALKIVPKTVMSLLIKELVPMEIGENKEVHLFMANNASLKVTKVEKDCYNGEIIEDNKKVADFLSRSIPGVGLYILSTFELYDMSLIDSDKKYDNKEEVEEKIQKLIDEKLLLRDLISQVVDKKLMEREAIEKLISHKLTGLMSENNKEKKEVAPVLEIPKSIEIPSSMTKKEEPKAPATKKSKGSPIVEFVEKRKNKPKEFKVEMAKGEHSSIKCPDCRKEIFDGTGISACICFGDDRLSKIVINKSEDGIKLAFSKDWDKENIEMLLEILRNKNG